MVLYVLSIYIYINVRWRRGSSNAMKMRSHITNEVEYRILTQGELLSLKGTTGRFL